MKTSVLLTVKIKKESSLNLEKKALNEKEEEMGREFQLEDKSAEREWVNWTLDRKIKLERRLFFMELSVVWYFLTGL